ncbi:MAG: aminodeoxychorismate synthase component I [Bacteroidota bacterium]
MLTKSEAIAKLNELGTADQPFSFYCDFLGEHWCIEDSRNKQKSTFCLTIDEPKTNNQISESNIRNAKFIKHPIGFDEFRKSFDSVIHEINIGNSFLTNLTFQTPLETDLSLEKIFHHSNAKYKLLVTNKFVVFSPETFIKIKGDFIYSYPMKGTINAELPNAKRLILEDIKEKAEHITIVDLIRNDLSQVALKVEVTKFRYIDEIQTNEKKLLQVSSEIKGKLGSSWKNELGSILVKLLPAGSISGAPKSETIRIIKENESYQRGFYTGVCGHFDGKSLDTGVMIRFIKLKGDRLYYTSGGGITSFSHAEKEYQEMVDKIYLPFH